MCYLLRHVIGARVILTGLVLLSLYTPAAAQALLEAFPASFSTPRHYTCFHVTDTPVIDGLLQEPAWQQAPWSQEFTDIEGDAQPSPPLATRVKMLWDDRCLYIAAELEEPHIWGALRQHDTIIFHDNDFEVFIDPDGDTHQYFEIEINALNTVMDLFMPKPYREGGQAMLNWDAKGLRTAVHINGTLNRPDDEDRHWTVEMAIPFSALGFYHRPATPRDSGYWRINFSRVEWDTDIRQGAYVKQPGPEHNWVWTPQGAINMHAPERWGYLWFTTRPPGSPAPAFALPPAEQAARYLWLAYYKQQQYKRRHGKYAPDLKALGLPHTVTDSGRTWRLQMESISRQYTVTIQGASLTQPWTIDQEGKITKR